MRGKYSVKVVLMLCCFKTKMGFFEGWSEKIFFYVNFLFAMYAGSILVTAVRLTWDPSTYVWFRFLFEIQYNVTTGYLYSVGLFLTVLVFLGISSVYPPGKRRLLTYFFGTLVLMISEVVYATWMYLTLRDWWEHSQQAELLRKGLALQDDVKALLLILQKHHQVAEEVNNAMHEAEQDAPKNAYVIVANISISVILQVTALIVCWILQSNTSTENYKANIKNYSVVPSTGRRSRRLEYQEDV